MPVPTLNKFADKIKQRKQFKDRKDKKKAALNYAEKKYKEAEDIVKKQYGGPDKVPGGKYYGTLMIILKNKLHLKESTINYILENKINYSTVNLKDIPTNDGKLTTDFSAWYIPYNNTIVYFAYAGHQRFMKQYLPNMDYSTKEMTIEDHDRKFEPILKHYYKDIVDLLKRWNENYVSYIILYKLGWIRLNMNGETDRGNITYSEKADENEVDKLLMYLKQNNKNNFEVEVDNRDKNGFIKIKKDEIPDSSQNNIVKGKIADVSRNRLFGPKDYSYPKNESRFDKVYQLIMEEQDFKRNEI